MSCRKRTTKCGLNYSGCSFTWTLSWIKPCSAPWIPMMNMSLSAKGKTIYGKGPQWNSGKYETQEVRLLRCQQVVSLKKINSKTSRATILPSNWTIMTIIYHNVHDSTWTKKGITTQITQSKFFQLYILRGKALLQIAFSSLKLHEEKICGLGSWKPEEAFLDGKAQRGKEGGKRVPNGPFVVNCLFLCWADAMHCSFCPMIT